MSICRLSNGDVEHRADALCPVYSCRILATFNCHWGIGGGTGNWREGESLRLRPIFHWTRQNKYHSALSTYQSEQLVPAPSQWSSCHWRQWATHWDVHHMAPHVQHSWWRRWCSLRGLRCYPALLQCRKKLQQQSPRLWSAGQRDNQTMSLYLLDDRELK